MTIWTRIGTEVVRLTEEDMELISGGAANCGCGDWGDPLEDTNK